MIDNASQESQESQDLPNNESSRNRLKLLFGTISAILITMTIIGLIIGDSVARKSEKYELCNVDDYSLIMNENKVRLNFTLPETYNSNKIYYGELLTDTFDSNVKMKFGRLRIDCYIEETVVKLEPTFFRKYSIYFAMFALVFGLFSLFPLCALGRCI